VPNCGVGTVYPSGAPELIPGFSEVRVARSLVFCAMFCKSLFLHLSFSLDLSFRRLICKTLDLSFRRLISKTLDLSFRRLISKTLDLSFRRLICKTLDLSFRRLISKTLDLIMAHCIMAM
jgi:hypothetical protein